MPRSCWSCCESPSPEPARAADPSIRMVGPVPRRAGTKPPVVWSNGSGKNDSYRGAGMKSDRESSRRVEPDPGARPNDCIHLPSLSIHGLLGIKELSIPRLGRVTLLAGRNGVGKTTVLDAVRIHASRARPAVLSDLLMGRKEIAAGKDEDGGRVSLSDARSLFFGRDTSADACISIGPLDGPDQLFPSGSGSLPCRRRRTRSPRTASRPNPRGRICGGRARGRGPGRNRGEVGRWSTGSRTFRRSSRDVFSSWKAGTTSTWWSMSIGSASHRSHRSTS